MPDVKEALRRRIISELDGIEDPCSLASGAPLGLDEMGLVDDIEISDAGDVRVRLRLTSPFCHMIGFFHVEAKRRLLALPGVETVTVEADNGLDWSPARIKGAGLARREAHLARMDARPVNGMPVEVSRDEAQTSRAA